MTLDEAGYQQCTRCNGEAHEDDRGPDGICNLCKAKEVE